MRSSQLIGMPRQSLRSGIFNRLTAVGLAVAVCVGVLAAPASAAAPVPRFLPSKLPAGYSYSDYADRTTPSSTIRFMRYYRNGTNTAAAVVTAEPGQKAEWDGFVRVLKSAGYRAVKIKTFTGYQKSTENGLVTYWFEKNRFLSQRTINITPAQHKAISASVVVSKLPDASFGMTKVPAGLGLVYAGAAAALFGSYSRLTWTNADRMELTLDVSSIDRRALDIYLLTPFMRYGTTQVNGKPAYVIEGEDFVEVWWEDQPGLLLEVSSDDLTAAALVEFATTLAPTDEATWQQYVNQPVTGSGTGSTGGTGGGTSGTDALVGAGVADGVPWSASLSSSPSCLTYSFPGSIRTDVCIKSPNALGWKLAAAEGKTFVVGVSAANIATVVVRNSAGAEIARAATGTVTNQPVLRLFVIAVPSGVATTGTVTGLDAAGAEVAPGIAAG